MEKRILELIDRCKLTCVLEMFESELTLLVEEIQSQTKENVLNVLTDQYDEYLRQYKLSSESYYEGALDAIDHSMQDIKTLVSPNWVYYWLNWMGPINYDFIKKNGEGWSAGRLELSDDSQFAVPIMRSKDWESLRVFLKTYRTNGKKYLNDIIADYEKTNPKITWFKSDEADYGR